MKTIGQMIAEAFSQVTAPTKLCQCGKLMIRRYSDRVLTTYPAQHPWYWWCGGCGRKEEGGIERGRTEEDMALADWRQANGLPLPGDTEKGAGA